MYIGLQLFEVKCLAKLLERRLNYKTNILQNKRVKKVTRAFLFELCFMKTKGFDS